MDIQELAVKRKLAQLEHYVEGSADEHAALEAAICACHYIGLHRAAFGHVVDTQHAQVPARRFEAWLVFVIIVCIT